MKLAFYRKCRLLNSSHDHSVFLVIFELPTGHVTLRVWRLSWSNRCRVERPAEAHENRATVRDRGCSCNKRCWLEDAPFCPLPDHLDSRIWLTRPWQRVECRNSPGLGVRSGRPRLELGWPQPWRLPFSSSASVSVTWRSRLPAVRSSAQISSSRRTLSC